MMPTRPLDVRDARLSSLGNLFQRGDRMLNQVVKPDLAAMPSFAGTAVAPLQPFLSTDIKDFCRQPAP